MRIAQLVVAPVTQGDPGRAERSVRTDARRRRIWFDGRVNGPSVLEGHTHDPAVDAAACLRSPPSSISRCMRGLRRWRRSISAARHNLPPRHLETMLQALVRAGILKGVRGPRGGYEIARERRRITAGDIVRAAMASTGEDSMPPIPEIRASSMSSWGRWSPRPGRRSCANSTASPSTTCAGRPRRKAVDDTVSVPISRSELDDQLIDRR